MITPTLHVARLARQESEQDSEHKMPRLTMESRRRVLVLKSIGMSVTKIQKQLKEEEIEVRRVALYKLFSKVKKSGSISHTSKQTQEKKIGEEQLLAIDEAWLLMMNLQQDNYEMLEERWQGIEVSISTMKCARKDLGWIATRPKYCQLIHNTNKAKRVLWCEQQLKNKERFTNVIFSDECTIQLDHHTRMFVFLEKETTEEAKTLC